MDPIRVLRTGVLALVAGVVGWYGALILIISIGGLSAVEVVSVPVAGLALGGGLAGLASGLSERVAARMVMGLTMAGAVFGAALGGLVELIGADVEGALVAGLLLVGALVTAARADSFPQT